MKKTLKTSLALAATALVSPASVMAADLIGDGTITVTGQKQYTIDNLVNSFLNWATVIGGFLALGYLIYAGIKYVMSAGDPGKVEEAQKQIISAIIGLAIIILAYSIIRIVMQLFGVSFGSLDKLTPTAD